MSSKCGIVGLPNIGKSTLFNLVVGKEQAEVADYPFCTIEPNIASILVKDKRLQILSNLEKSEKIIYGHMELYDIAGLVEGASKGEGLGNQFLGTILEVDVILHVVRLFKSDSLEEDYDPVKSLELIRTEILLWDLQRIENKLKNSKKKTDEETLEVEELIKIKEKLLLGEIYHSKTVKFPLICTKPMIVLGNGDDPELLESIEEYCKKNNYQFFNFDFSIGTEEDCQKIIIKAYQALNLINFFTCGPKETRAWTIKKGTNYKDGAGEIHSDIKKGFVCANVIPWDQYKLKSPVMKKSTEIIEDGDVIIFKHH